MKEDAVDSVVCDGEQERCEWSLLVIEDKRRLAIELVYLRLQVRAAGRRRDECGDPGSTLSSVFLFLLRCRSTSAPTTIRFGQWQANLRILAVAEIKTVPYVTVEACMRHRLLRDCPRTSLSGVNLARRPVQKPFVA